MSRALYSVWLQQCIGYNSNKIKQILDYFGSAEDVYNASHNAKIDSRLFSQKQLNRFLSYTLDDARGIIDKCEKYNYSVLSIEDENYPQRLYEISNPPCVLYVSGKMPDVDNTLTIAVVGTRTATTEGIRNSFTFGRDLSKCGAIVVSGGALGIDCASHRGVLQNDGVTICVLGCGINCNYLPENAQMRKLITNKGALISEYPPDTPPTSYNFPARNRIISGLSNGVLVIESGLKSGSLITANLALEQNRDVFSVPGSLINARAQGTNSLLKHGAILVTSYKDIVSEYAQQYNLYVEHETVMADDNEISEVPVAGQRIRQARPVNKTVYPANNLSNNNTEQKNIGASDSQKSKCPDCVSDEAKLVYGALSDAPLNIDQIADKLNMPAQFVMSALTELEIFDAAKNISGGRYTRV